MALNQEILACSVGVLIIASTAGCLAADSSRDTAVIPSAVVPEVPAEGGTSGVKDALRQTTLASPDTLWITIDAIPDHTRNNPLRITGKTNLGVTEPVLIEVYPLWWSDVTKRSQCAGAEIAGASFTGTFFPVKGYGIPNEWNFTGSPATFPNQEYIVVVSSVDRGISNTSAFAIYGTDEPQQTKGAC